MTRSLDISDPLLDFILDYFEMSKENKIAFIENTQFGVAITAQLMALIALCLTYKELFEFIRELTQDVIVDIKKWYQSRQTISEKNKQKNDKNEQKKVGEDLFKIQQQYKLPPEISTNIFSLVIENSQSKQFLIQGFNFAQSKQFYKEEEVYQDSYLGAYESAAQGYSCKNSK